jgi:hypothetical protein
MPRKSLKKAEFVLTPKVLADARDDLNTVCEFDPPLTSSKKALDIKKAIEEQAPCNVVTTDVLKENTLKVLEVLGIEIITPEAFEQRCVENSEEEVNVEEEEEEQQEDDEKEEKEESTDEEEIEDFVCPGEGEFGQDYGMYEACEECLMREECEIEVEKLGEEEEAQQEEVAPVADADPGYKLSVKEEKAEANDIANVFVKAGAIMRSLADLLEGLGEGTIGKKESMKIGKELKDIAEDFSGMCAEKKESTKQAPKKVGKGKK